MLFVVWHNVSLSGRLDEALTKQAKDQQLIQDVLMVDFPNPVYSARFVSESRTT